MTPDGNGVGIAVHTLAPAVGANAGGTLDMATAVISAIETMHYGHALVPALNVETATVALLGVFAVVNIIGVNRPRSPC